MANIDIQFAVDTAGIPDAETIKNWVTTALNGEYLDAEISLRVVDETEIKQLNKQYRAKDKATNVLSFPAELPAEWPSHLGIKLLGDVVICAEIVKKEATEQNKTLTAHWAHMIVHSTLHLLGYDHIDDTEAELMETQETKILAELGFPAPYSIV